MGQSGSIVLIAFFKPGFHFLQTFEHFEIMRGMAGIGDYHLKAEFSRASIPPEELVLPIKKTQNPLPT
jgi:hypothetical protein